LPALTAEAPSNRLRAVGAFVLSSFGPIIVFYAVNYGWGLMAAIAASAAWSIADVVRHLVTKKPISTIFKFSAAMTVVFGAVDLLAQQSLLFKYEAVVSNVATAAVFAGTLRAGKSIMQESYERSPRAQGRPMPPWLPSFFRVATYAWVAYFLVKAVIYFFVARAYPIEQAMGIRVVFGNVTMGVMFGLTWVIAKLYARAQPKTAPSPSEAELNAKATDSP
jgi:intracellular septation protein A